MDMGGGRLGKFGGGGRFHSGQWKIGNKSLTFFGSKIQ